MYRVTPRSNNWPCAAEYFSVELEYASRKVSCKSDRGINALGKASLRYDSAFCNCTLKFLAGVSGVFGAPLSAVHGHLNRFHTMPEKSASGKATGFEPSS